MRTVTTSTAALLLVALASCGGQPPAGPSATAPALPAAAPPAIATAPAPLGVPVDGDKVAPYTPEQIRNATRAGRTYRYRIVREGKPTKLDEMRFVRVDERGADISSSSREDGGPATEPKVRPVTWAELRAHGEFPRAAVTITDEAIDVPAGHFSCMVFTLKILEKNEVSRFYFARELPGAPVLYYTEEGGRRTMTATLVEHKR